MAQSTIHRRISLQRSVANFGKKKDTCLQPLRSVPFQKEEPEELPRQSSQNSMHSCASLPRISSASSYLAFIWVPAFGPSELFSLKWDDVDLTRGVIGIRLVGQILNARHGQGEPAQNEAAPGQYMIKASENDALAVIGKKRYIRGHAAMRSMSLIRFRTIGQQAYQAFSSSLSSDNRITERRRHGLPPKETGMEHAADTKAVWLHESAP